MPMKRLPNRGWVNVPNQKRVRGPVTITKEQWSKLEQWALELEKDTRNERIRPKEREKAHYVLQQVAMLFRSMGFEAVTGHVGLRVFEPMTEEEITEMRARLDTDPEFLQEVRNSLEYWGQY